MKTAIGLALALILITIASTIAKAEAGGKNIVFPGTLEEIWLISDAPGGQKSNLTWTIGTRENSGSFILRH